MRCAIFGAACAARVIVSNGCHHIRFGHHHCHGLLRVSCPPPPPPPNPAVESVRCRTQLNNAAQEIANLQREVWQLERELNWTRAEHNDACTDGSSMKAPALGRQSQETPVYAVTPIGRIDRTDAEAQSRSEPIFLNRYPVITNLGAMVDVLV